MSYKTYNLIVKIDGDKEALLNDLNSSLKYHYVHEFFVPFNGIVCQISDNLKEVPFQRFNNDSFKDQEDVILFIENELKNYSVKLSVAYPSKTVAFITVDCFGGRCESEGFTLINGEKNFEQEMDYSAHISILKKIDDDYASWHFYPFTRDFYTRKAGIVGGIVGDIDNFTLAAIWMSFHTEFSNQPGYIINAAANELVVEKENYFEFYFMKIDDSWIKILGRLYDDREANIADAKRTIESNLGGLDYQVQFDIFSNGHQEKSSTLSEKRSKELTLKSYRSKSFNDRPFIYSTDDGPAGNSSSTENKGKETKSGVLKNILQKIFGKR